MDKKMVRNLAAGSIMAAASLAGLAAPAMAQKAPPNPCGCEPAIGQETAFLKWQVVAFPKLETTAFPKLEATAFPKVETHALFYKLQQLSSSTD